MKLEAFNAAVRAAGPGTHVHHLVVLNGQVIDARLSGRVFVPLCGRTGGDRLVDTLRRQKKPPTEPAWPLSPKSRE